MLHLWCYVYFRYNIIAIITVCTIYDKQATNVYSDYYKCHRHNIMVDIIEHKTNQVP